MHLLLHLIEVQANVVIEFFVVLFLEHVSEPIRDGSFFHGIFIQLASLEHKPHDRIGAVVGFNVAEIAPFDTEANDRFEDGIILAAVDGRLVQFMVGDVVHESVAFFGGALRIIEE